MTISSVTSEALQLKLRQLLPSQQGFGTDLSASDTIIPVIDLTASAEGSDVRPDLQLAIAFGSQTAFDVSNATTTILSNTGFFRIFGNCTIVSSGALTFNFSDGTTSKQILKFSANASQFDHIAYDFIVFLTAGDSLSLTSTSINVNAVGSTRQIADINGTLVQPAGFTPQ